MLVLGLGGYWWFSQSGAEPDLVPFQGKLIGPEGKSPGPSVIQFWQTNKTPTEVPFALVSGRTGEFSVVMDIAREGMPPGQYKVVVNTVRSAHADKIPKKYREYSTTPLTVNVSRKGVTGHIFRLDP